METNTTLGGLAPLIGIEELAEYIDVPVKTLYKWRQEGTDSCSVRVGRHVRYFVSDVRDWLSQQRGFEQVGASADEVAKMLSDHEEAPEDRAEVTALPIRNEVHYDQRVFERVDWSKRGEYMQRKHGITPQVADDALGDPNRIVIDPDYNSTSGESVRIIGFSPIADDIVTVIVLQHKGTEYGVNGWSANEKDRGIYNEGSYAGEEGEAP